MKTVYRGRRSGRRSRVQARLRARSPGSRPGLSATRCRFENAARRSNLYRRARALADTLLGSLRKRYRCARQSRIDVDPTCTPTSSAQQQTFFNGYYVILSAAADHRFLSRRSSEISAGAAAVPRQRRCHAERPAHPPASAPPPPNPRAQGPALTTRRRRLRRPDLLDWLDDQSIGYGIGVASNSVLARKMQEVVEMVRGGANLAAKDSVTSSRVHRLTRRRAEVCRRESKSYPKRSG